MLSNKKKKRKTIETLKAGGSDVASSTWNLLVGDRNNGISQVYSGADLAFGKKTVVLLKSVKLGFDMDYITGIQSEYIVGLDRAVGLFVESPDSPGCEVLRVEDPSKIKGSY